MVKGFRARMTLAALVPVMLGWLAVTPQPPAQAQAQEPDMRVRLNEITPAVTGDTKTITASGRVDNTGDMRLEDVKASLWISDNPLQSREDLRRVANSDRSGLDVLPGDRIAYEADLVADVTDELARDESGRFEVNVPVEQLSELTDIGQTGTYVVGVDVRGTVEETGVRHTWRERVFMPWVRTPDGENTSLTPVEVAYLLPMTARPLRTDQVTLLGSGPDPAQLFASDGRLSKLLDVGAKYGLTYLMDPALLELAGRVQEGYRFTGDGDTEPNRTGGAKQAARFLDRARGLLGSQDAMMLPYADPDLPALHRNDLAGRYSTAIETAEQAAEEYGVNPEVLAWPGAGFATTSMLSTAAESGAERVLLRSGALPGLQSDTEPVVSLTTDAGPVTALVTDPALTSSGPGGATDGLQRRQRLLAETALIAMRDGPSSESRRMVTTLPRSWDGAGAETLLSAATGGEFSWLRPLSVSALLSQSPATYGGKLTYPEHQREQEIGGDLMQQLHRLDGQADRYLELLAEPQAQRAVVDREFLRAASTAWRSAPRRGNQLASQMTEELSRANNSGVGIIAPRTVTLSDNQGRFPVTVSNDLDQTIDVEIHVSTGENSGLQLEQVGPVEVPRWRKATASVTATAQESGSHRVTAQLRTTEDHRPVGQPVTFQVRVSGFGQVGWAIIGAGIGLLVLAMVVRVVRRARAARNGQSTGDEQSTGSEQEEERNQEQAETEQEDEQVTDRTHGAETEGHDPRE